MKLHDNVLLLIQKYDEEKRERLKNMEMLKALREEVRVLVS